MRVTRGMQRRTAKLARRAAIVDAQTLVAGVDIAKRESVVVFVRASDKARVARLTVPTSAAGIGGLAAYADEVRQRHGLQRVVLAMEPTGHLWKIVARAAARLGLEYVAVQSFVVARSREIDDLTRDKTDQRDAGLIADLACELRFTELQLEEGAWAELRSLAQARDRYRVERGAALQEQRAFLELTWPTLLQLVPDLDGTHLQATLTLGISPVEIAAMSQSTFTALLRPNHPQRFLPWMAGRIWAAARTALAEDQSPAATLRITLAGQRVQNAKLVVDQLDRRMTEAFEQTGLGWLRGQIRGLGNAALINILAFSGDPRRLDDARCMVKLAGSNPTERSSGEQVGAGGIHRRGRPTLRLLGHQASICLVQHNPDFRARFLYLTHRANKPLHKKAAYIAVCNKLLRTLWSMSKSGEHYRSQLGQAA